MRLSEVDTEEPGQMEAYRKRKNAENPLETLIVIDSEDETEDDDMALSRDPTHKV